MVIQDDFNYTKFIIEYRVIFLSNVKYVSTIQMRQQPQASSLTSTDCRLAAKQTLGYASTCVVHTMEHTPFILFTLFNNLKVQIS